MKVLPAPGDLRPEPARVPLAGSGASPAPSRVASCLVCGWRAARPHDSLTLLPMVDGEPGSVQVITFDQAVSWEAIQGRGPFGQVREADPVCLVPRPSRPGNRHSIEASTWLLNAARLLTLPSDPDEAAQEALEGSTSGLGEVIGAALSRTSPLDTFVVGMSYSAVHDGGLGAIDVLGGLRAAKDPLSHRSLGLTLADDISLGGMNGAGAVLTSTTSISLERIQELDRHVCAKVMESIRAAEGLDPGGFNACRSLPVVSALDGAGPSASTRVVNSAGTVRLSASTWGIGASGGSVLLLRALGAWMRSGARVMTELVCLSEVVYGQSLVVSARGELYNVLADGVVGVVGQQAASQAQPCILVCRRCAVSRGELTATGVTNAYGLQKAHAAEPWEMTDFHGLEARLVDLDSRLARTQSY